MKISIKKIWDYLINGFFVGSWLIYRQDDQYDPHPNKMKEEIIGRSIKPLFKIWSESGAKTGAQLNQNNETDGKLNSEHERFTNYGNVHRGFEDRGAWNRDGQFVRRLWQSQHGKNVHRTSIRKDNKLNIRKVVTQVCEKWDSHDSDRRVEYQIFETLVVVLQNGLNLKKNPPFQKDLHHALNGAVETGKRGA